MNLRGVEYSLTHKKSVVNRLQKEHYSRGDFIYINNSLVLIARSDDNSIALICISDGIIGNLYFGPRKLESPDNCINIRRKTIEDIVYNNRCGIMYEICDAEVTIRRADES